MARAKTPAAAGGPRRFGPLAKLVTASLVIAMFVVAFELFLRISGLVTGMPYSAYDVGTGPRIAPNQSGRYIRGQWVRGWYRYNAQGWNHPEDYVVAKPPGTTRIAMVGDSQVAAQQVDVTETMFMRAQRSMSAAGRPTEWYAFGVSGYGTAQELEIVRHHALKYSPDVVVLMFVANDPYDTSPYLVDIEPYYPRYVLDGQGDLLRLPQSTWSFPWWKREITQMALFRYFGAQKGIGAKLRHLRNPGAQPGLWRAAAARGRRDLQEPPDRRAGGDDAFGAPAEDVAAHRAAVAGDAGRVPEAGREAGDRLSRLGGGDRGPDRTRDRRCGGEGGGPVLPRAARAGDGARAGGPDRGPAGDPLSRPHLCAARRRREQREVASLSRRQALLDGGPRSGGRGPREVGDGPARAAGCGQAWELGRGEPIVCTPEGQLPLLLLHD